MIGKLEVRDAMTRQVLTIRADATLREMQALIARHGVDVLPVVIRDETGAMRALAGIATRSDLLSVLLEAKTLRGLEARRQRPVLSLLRRVSPLRSGDVLTDAARRLVEDGLPALPVADSRGRIVGILSLADILDRASQSAGAAL